MARAKKKKADVEKFQKPKMSAQDDEIRAMKALEDIRQRKIDACVEALNKVLADHKCQLMPVWRNVRIPDPSVPPVAVSWMPVPVNGGG